MEIKILCSCGNKYRFEVAPVNGRVPTSLSCPQCSASWTDYANSYIAKNLKAEQPPPAEPSSAPSAPVSANPPAAGSGLRINLAAEPPEEKPSGLNVAVATAPPRPAPLVAAVLPQTAPEREENFALGLLGSFLGAAVGGLIFFLVFKYSGYQIKLVALAVGFLAGLGGRLLGKGGSMELGIITGVLTLAGIVSAEYAFAKSFWDRETVASTGSEYEMVVVEATEAVKAIPTGSDQEIRTYLAKQLADDDEKPDPTLISAEDIKEFREKELPEMRDLASGKLTKEEYEKKQKTEMAKSAQDEPEDKKAKDTYFTYFFMIVFLNRFNLACMVGAVALAYKMTDT